MGAAIYTLRGSVQSKATTPTPIVTPAIPAVSALGRLEPQGNVIKLSAPSSIQGARVTKLLVEEGDKVRENQAIAILDNRDRLQAALEKSKQQVRVAQANLAKVRAGAKTGEIGASRANVARYRAELQGQIATQRATLARLEAELQGERQAQSATISRLQAQLRNAESELRRYQQLYGEGAIEASTYDTKRLNVETAREELNQAIATRTQTTTTLTQQIQEARAIASQTVATLNQQINEAQSTLNQVAEVRPVDIAEANAQVQDALASVRQAQADLELAYIRSPVTGQVLKIHARPGESITDDDGIAELGQTERMLAIAEVYESDISKVKLKQQVTLTSEGNAFNGELQGSVIEIGRQIGKKDVLDTDPAADTDARVVEVKIRLDPESSRRVANLTYSKVVVKILI